jgi:hypothetical protein
MSAAAHHRVTLSLISHTNAGKTTLARTLLRNDVGEVRDAPHVTQFNESHTLIREGSYELRLWDTPGFGDTARLLKRLKQQDKPLLWFISQAWDRMTDKPLWCSQQALRNVREEADVILYLVNAAEAPADATYVAHEMEILSWVKKPVLVLLNQTGPARPMAEELVEVKAWSSALRSYDCVKSVLQLDAFTSCWVQEDTLMSQLHGLLNEEKKASFIPLQKAWSLLDGAEIRDATIPERLGLGSAGYNRELAAARHALSTRLAQRMETTTNALIELHRLTGNAEQQMLRTSREHFQQPVKVSESILGALGGVVAGAMAGLWADLHAGGMTFGGGALLGGIGGGLSAYAVAKGYNLVRGQEGQMHWSQEHFRQQARLALLCYLAVAHHGRGRGDWQHSALPEVWTQAADAAIEQHQAVWDSLWKQGVEQKAPSAAMKPQMTRLMHSCISAALRRLYPAAG